MNLINIYTSDNYKIVGNHFVPTKSKNEIILINAATGIKQSFYFKYAEFLAKQGFDVITYDYRGIGSSKYDELKGFSASMTDWGNIDFTAMSNYINQNFASHKKILLGHSFGGNSVGLSENANCFDAYITIASQYGYWKNFNLLYKPVLLWVFYIIMPILANIYGYFPSKVKKLGEKLPKGVAKDWITLITNPNSMLELAKKTGNYYETINKPMLMISISDDQMAPKKTVDVLRNVYKNAIVKRIHIEAKKNKPIGHLNFFRKQFEFDLWEIPTNWILQLEMK
jgi:predicted alpha/beta hydrolase